MHAKNNAKHHKQIDNIKI